MDNNNELQQLRQEVLELKLNRAIDSLPGLNAQQRLDMLRLIRTELQDRSDVNVNEFVTEYARARNWHAPQEAPAAQRPAAPAGPSLSDIRPGMTGEQRHSVEHAIHQALQRPEDAQRRPGEALELHHVNSKMDDQTRKDAWAAIQLALSER